MRPDTIRISDDRSELFVEWEGTAPLELAAPLLRENARDAHSIRQRLDFGPIPAPADLRIDAIEPIGAMGLNISFSDGHDRAIYPWDYLRKIAASADSAIN